ncbi:MAG TPA: Zn-dependent alcohol dehydrogenase [Acidimicrobiia bacterium]|nr:Zn-dependent alcohol dehydrogenase [Acidimicrobiia bacterium]
MRAAVLEEVGVPVGVADLEIRKPKPGEVLVRVVACGVCHSDLSIVDGSFPSPLPVVLGHEAAGVVEEIGVDVTSVAPGDQVILTPLPPCGRCYFCTRNQPTLCATYGGSLFTSLMADGTSPLSRDGEVVYRGLATAAWAEQAIMPEAGVVKVDPDVELETACVIGCAVQTGVGAVLNTANVEAGATVLVFGAGGIGIAVIQGARIAGAARIIVSDPVAERREAALAFGATDVIEPADVMGAVPELTDGIGVDYAFEAAGQAALIEQGIMAVRSGGTIVCVGAPAIDQGISIPGVVGFTASEKRLIGCLLGSVHSHRDVPRLLALWKAGRLDLENMITARLPLTGTQQALDSLVAREGIRTVLIPS